MISGGPDAAADLHGNATLMPTPLSRRDFLAGLAVVAGCAKKAEPRAPEGRAITLWSWFDLPAGDPRSRELSGIAWDARAGVLWAVQDERPNIVELRPDAELRAWSFGTTIAIDAAEPLDLEGLVVLPDGFIVCSEDGPLLLEVDRSGRVRRELALPARFRDARPNKSLESLTTSPSGRSLFTTSEIALRRDGGEATTGEGTRVRLLRFERAGARAAAADDGWWASSEHVYVTDPLPWEAGDWGVADLAATGDDALLVLERGWARGRGNAARVYATSLDRRASCAGVDALGPSSPALEKTLLVDLGTLDAAGLPEPKQPQSSALLDNYEGMTLGPRLRDGRSTLILVSDDNDHADQVARVLVLALGAGWGSGATARGPR